MKAILVIIVAIPFLTQAQEQFSFELFFEDELGNKDTLTLGHDPNATDSIDVTFGEINIKSQPWNPVFEVRSFENYFVPDTAMFKKDIRTNQSNFPILVKSVYDSIKISWNSNTISGAIQGSSLSNDLGSLAYLSQQDSITISKNELLSEVYDIDTLYRLYLDFSAVFSSISWNKQEHFDVHPNPNNGEFWIKLNEQVQKGEIIITDLTGKQIAKVSVSNTTNVSLSNMSEGVYLINLVSENTIIDTQKIVIQR